MGWEIYFRPLDGLSVRILEYTTLFLANFRFLLLFATWLWAIETEDHGTIECAVVNEASKLEEIVLKEFVSDSIDVAEVKGGEE